MGKTNVRTLPLADASSRSIHFSIGDIVRLAAGQDVSSLTPPLVAGYLSGLVSLSMLLMHGAAWLAVRFPELRLADFGHLGDGGMHFNMVWPSKAGSWGAEQELTLREGLYALVAELGGSISAEVNPAPVTTPIATAPALLRFRKSRRERPLAGLSLQPFAHVPLSLGGPEIFPSAMGNSLIRSGFQNCKYQAPAG